MYPTFSLIRARLKHSEAPAKKWELYKCLDLQVNAQHSECF